MDYGKWTDAASSEWEDEQETYLDQEAEAQWQATLQDRAFIWERDFANLSEEARESLMARLDDLPENVRGVLQCILRARGLPPCDDGFPTIMPPEAYKQKRLMRLYAKLQLDETMREAFRSGEDIHAVTASQVFGVPLSEVTAQQRSSAAQSSEADLFAYSDTL